MRNKRRSARVALAIRGSLVEVNQIGRLRPKLANLSCHLLAHLLLRASPAIGAREINPGLDWIFQVMPAHRQVIEIESKLRVGTFRGVGLQTRDRFLIMAGA